MDDWRTSLARQAEYLYNFTCQNNIIGSVKENAAQLMSKFISELTETLYLFAKYIYTGFKKGVGFLGEPTVTSLHIHARKVLRKLPHAIQYCLLMGLAVTLAICLLFAAKVFQNRLCLVRRKRNRDLRPTEDITDYKYLDVFELAKTAYEPGHTDAVFSLMNQNQFDVNYIIPSKGLSLFLSACLSGKRDLILQLLQRGADVTVTSSDGDSALYIVTYALLNQQTPDLKVLQDIIIAGCDVNWQNKKGFTALHQAASKGSIPIIHTLLKNGANPYICSNSGVYPIDSATTAGFPKAAKLLMINLESDDVWDIVEPHTPSSVKLGLLSPRKRHLAESTWPMTTVNQSLRRLTRSQAALRSHASQMSSENAHQRPV